jgi:hypothetical protein
MRKQDKIIAGATAGFLALTVGILSFGDANSFLSPVLADVNPYSITLDSSAAIGGTSGTFAVHTSAGTEIDFAYKGTNGASSFLTLEKMGYLKNTTALTDLSAITATYSDSLSGLYVSYGWLNSANEVVYAVENAQLVSGSEYVFNNDSPAFVKISAIREIPISSIKLSYKCAGGTATTKSSYFTDESNYQTVVASSSSSLTVQQAAYCVAHAARREGAGALSGNLLSAASLTSSASSTLTEATAAELLYCGFHDTLPSKVGARSFEAYDSSSTLSGLSSSSAYYPGVAMLSNAGILAPLSSSSSTVFSAASALDKSGLNLYLSRLHSYYGLSLKDDFYSTVNHDYLYESCTAEDTSATGTAYDSQLIPDSRIASWVDSKFDGIGAAASTAATNVNNFLSTAFESGGHVAGTTSSSLGGLGSLVSSIMSVSSATAMKTLYKNLLTSNGWCPLWDDLANTWLGSSSYYYYLVGTPYNIYSSAHSASDYASGASYRTQQESGFTTLLTSILGNATTAATYASNYLQWCYLWYTAATNSYSSYLSTAKIATTTTATSSLLYACTGITTTKLKYFYFYNYGALQATTSLFTDTNLAYVKAFTLIESLLHFWQCLPNAAALSWQGEGTTRTGLQTKPAFFTTYFSPYIENDLCNWYATTDEYATKEAALASVFGDIKTYLSTRFTNNSWISSSGKTTAKGKLTAIDYNLMMSYGITNTSGTLTSSGTLSYTSYAYTSLGSGGTLYANMGIHDAPAWTTQKGKIGTAVMTSIQPGSL